MLISFLDESGHSSGTEFFALAAFVADNSDWAQFDDQWRRALEWHGAPYLHMREFAFFRGPFKGWTEDRRRGLLGDCVRAINSIRAVAVGAAMAVEDFKKLGVEAQSAFQDPFFCCFQEVVRGVAHNAIFESEGLKVQVVFSKQDEFSAMARKLWNGMAEHIDVKERMGSLEFQDMRAVPALQAADLLAYELRRFYHLRQTKPGALSRWAFREIVLHQRKAHVGGMLKYLPGWYLELQAAGIFDEFMGIMLKYPSTLSLLLAEMVPDPV